MILLCRNFNLKGLGLVDEIAGDVSFRKTVEGGTIV